MNNVIQFPDTNERMARRIQAQLPCDVLAKVLCAKMGLPTFGKDIGLQLNKPRDQTNVQILERWIPTIWGSEPPEDDDPLDLIPVLEYALREVLKAAAR